MTFFVKDSDVFYYEDKGKGEPIVLINGFTRSSRHWLGFERLLAEHHRVITIDNRGVGRSKGARAGWDLTVFQMADDVAALMRHLGIESAHIVGLSMGGMIAMGMGVKYPQMLRSLTIMNSSIAGQKPLQVATRTIWKLLDVLEDRKRFNYVIGHLLVAPDYPHLNQLKDKWHSFEVMEPVTMSMAIKQFAAIKRFRAAKLISRINVPTLVLKGSADQFVPTENSDIIQSLIPNSIMGEIRGGGHEMTIDHPREVCEAIDQFVGDVAFAAEETAKKRSRAA